MCVCVCVRVCVRERVREREITRREGERAEWKRHVLRYLQFEGIKVEEVKKIR